MNEQEIIRSCIADMKAHGIEPDPNYNFTADGTRHRFDVVGDKRGSINGFAYIYSDGTPAAHYGSWRTCQDGINWCSKRASEMTEDETRQHLAEMKARKAARDKAEKDEYRAAAERARYMLQRAPHSTDDHPYLRAKKVGAHGLHVGNWPLVGTDRFVSDCLLVPIHDVNGAVWSVQAIAPSKAFGYGDNQRNKDMLKGGCKRRHFYMIGQVRGDIPLVVCEGFATGATIHEATGYTVAVAFDAGNLPHVAEALRKKYPKATMAIAADDDRDTLMPVPNPGVYFAERAGSAGRARVLVPQFASHEGTASDFNDLAVREGIEAVRRQFTDAMTFKPVTVEVNDDGEVTVFDPSNVDGYTAFPDITDKGKPKATIPNVKELLRRAGIACRYNVVSKDLEITMPGKHVGTIGNKSEASPNRIKSMCRSIDFPVLDLEGYLLTIGDEDTFNPVAEWIDSGPWDGVSRLQDLYDTVVASDDLTMPCGGSMKEVLMRKWLISAVAAACTPEGGHFVSRGVLVFQGEQNLGKTRWVKQLAPRHLNCIKDGLTLDPKNKDDVMTFASHWIVELGELDGTFRKSDIAALKSFISLEKDVLRRPYARTDSKYQRRTVAFASVNDKDYLHDPTGNTRWWTITVAALNNDHDIDMQQLWSEVRTLFDAGETWHLTTEEIAVLEGKNAEHTVQHPTEERVYQFFAELMGKGHPDTFHTVRDAWQRAMDMPGVAPGRNDGVATGKALKRVTKKESKRNSKGTARGWELPTPGPSPSD
jgi:putative DNA primase/helicase